MKKLLFALAITALFISTTAFAQLNWEDNIGLYFDETATTSCEALPTLTFGSGFLAVTHLTSNSLAGWEVKITSTGGGQFPSITPRGDFINAASIPGEFIVGLGTPLVPVNGTVVLADLDFVITDDTNPFYGSLDHVYFDSMGNNLPAYVDGDDRNLLKRMVPALGELGNPQLIANGDCSGVVDNEDASFGNVKALFR